MDHLHTLNESTPKIKCIGRTGVDPALIFGLDSKLFMIHPLVAEPYKHDDDHRQNQHNHNHPAEQHEEVETVTVLRPLMASSCDSSTYMSLTQSQLEAALAILPKDVVYRVKGFIDILKTPLSSSTPSTMTEGSQPSEITNGAQATVESFILNWAFGRFDLVPFDDKREGVTAGDGKGTFRLTMMGERGEIKRKWGKKFAETINGVVVA
jgi:G3E family GTPase